MKGYHNINKLLILFSRGYFREKQTAVIIVHRCTGVILKDAPEKAQILPKVTSKLELTYEIKQYWSFLTES